MGWEEYFKAAKTDFKKGLEEDEKIFDFWISLDERYVLISRSLGKSFRVGSDSVEKLKEFWASYLSPEKYDNSTQHFIVDTQDRKIVEFLSVCM